MQQHLVVFGHSHVWSMKRAVAARKSPSPPTIEVALCGTDEMPGPIVYHDQGRDFLSAMIVALLNRVNRSENAANTWLLSMVQGNYYNKLGMLAVGGRFDFVLKSEPDLPLLADASLIPYTAMRSMLARYMAEQEIYQRLMKWMDVAPRLIIFGAPPPPKDEAPILALLEKEKQNAPVTPASVRLKLWKLQNEIFSEWSAKHGMIFLSGGFDEVQDEEGFLRPEFVKDAVHANGAWAERYLEKAIGIMTAGQAH